MALSLEQMESLLEKGFSRRQLGRIATLLTAGSALPFANEYAMAQDGERRSNERRRRPTGPNVIRISSNENPMGPCKEGLEALNAIAPMGWRYAPGNEQHDLINSIADTENVKPNYISAHAGSSDPLHRVQCAYTSPTKSWTMANPGYGSGAPAFIGSKLVQVPLRADYSHDVEAMIRMDPNAGVYYVVNPNNPTGTPTARKDIEYLLANKQKDAIVLVDEAYIHFSDIQSCNDLVAADKDIIVLKTFSKIYGMAGIRSGFALGRPDLLAKLRSYGVGMNPCTGTACAAASLKAKYVVPERKALMKNIREDVFSYLDKKNIKHTPSVANFFMMETNRPNLEVIDAFADQNIVIGRPWPVWPTRVRITIGTQGEMDKFKVALEKIMA